MTTPRIRPSQTGAHDSHNSYCYRRQRDVPSTRRAGGGSATGQTRPGGEGEAGRARTALGADASRHQVAPERRPASLTPAAAGGGGHTASAPGGRRTQRAAPRRGREDPQPSLHRSETGGGASVQCLPASAPSPLPWAPAPALLAGLPPPQGTLGPPRAPDPRPTCLWRHSPQGHI